MGASASLKRHLARQQLHFRRPLLGLRFQFLDLFLTRMSGIECTAKLKVMRPETPIVMLTASDEDEILFLALESGADGYLLKRTKPAG